MGGRGIFRPSCCFTYTPYATFLAIIILSEPTKCQARSPKKNFKNEIKIFEPAEKKSNQPINQSINNILPQPKQPPHNLITFTPQRIMIHHIRHPAPTPPDLPRRLHRQFKRHVHVFHVRRCIYRDGILRQLGLGVEIWPGGVLGEDVGDGEEGGEFGVVEELCAEDL